MGTLRANGEVIERRIEEMKLEDPLVNYTVICDRTADLGPGFIEVGSRTLQRARDSQKIDALALRALAEVLKVALADIIVTDGEQELRSRESTSPRMTKTMTAISSPGAPAVNAEEHATVSISINSTHRRDDADGD